MNKRIRQASWLIHQMPVEVSMTNSAQILGVKTGATHFYSSVAQGVQG